MKTVLLLLLTIVICATIFLFVSAAFAATDPNPPEFFFTRLAYSESPNGCCRHRGGYGFGFGFRGRAATMPVPNRQFICPEFGGGNFFPPQGWGWGIDYPGGDCKF